jgi:D-xylose transport system permease protein
MLRGTPEVSSGLETTTEPVATKSQRAKVHFNWRSYGMLIALAVIVVLFSYLTDGTFISPRNVAQLMRQAAVLIVVAAGVAILIIQREIDLSIGSAVYLAGLAAATAQTEWGWGTVPAITLALAVGVAMGAWQGFWVARFAIPSFVVTLSSLLAFRGIGYVWSDAATYAPMNRSYGALSESFIPPVISAVLIIGLLVAFTAVMLIRMGRQRRRFGGRAVPMARAAKPIIWAGLLAVVLLYPSLGYRGLPMAVAIALLVTAVLGFVTLGTTFGRKLYAIGGNREAAYLSGINIGKQSLTVLLLWARSMLLGASSSPRGLTQLRLPLANSWN